MIELILLAMGGALGAVSRFGVGRHLGHYAWASGFPWATLLINTLGCIGLGALLAIRFGEVPEDPYGDQLFLFLGVGFFAAFTTFSTFSTETLALYQQGRAKLAATYIALTLFACFAAFGAAFALAN